EENLPPGLPWRAAARPRATEAGAERLVLRLQLGGGDHEAWSQAAAIEARRTDAAEARGRSRMAAVEKAGDVDAALDTVEHPRKVVVDEQRAAREVDGTERLVLGAVRAALFVAVGVVNLGAVTCELQDDHVARSCLAHELGGAVEDDLPGRLRVEKQAGLEPVSFQRTRPGL